MKDKLLYTILILLCNTLNAQSVDSAQENYASLLGDVELAANYGTLAESESISVYPRIIKDAQVFVLYFDLKIEDPYTVTLMTKSGEEVETIYNSQLSVFDAKSSLTLEVYTPLPTGQYYVVVKTDETSIATKLLKYKNN